jgi:soluble lytic murein transglycosylase-like protein
MMQFRALTLPLCLASALSCSIGEQRGLPEAALSFAVTAEQAAIESRLSELGVGLGAGEIRATARAILEEAERNALEPELILAVIQIESAYYNFARSRVGALGLMQVMPATGQMLARQHGLEWNGPQTLFDPVANVRLGCRYLAALRARYGRIDAALAAYNWGPGAIDRRIALGSGLPRRYPALVLAQLDLQSFAEIR